MESKKAQDVFEHHRKLTELLEAFERRAYDDWLANVDEQCSFNLNQPLLSRDDETKLLKLNFDDQVCFRAVLASRLSFTICHGITGIISRHLQLVAVLREVRYFEERGREDIPDSAAAIYAKNDTLRDYVNNLNLTVQWYNKGAQGDARGRVSAHRAAGERHRRAAQAGARQPHVEQRDCVGLHPADERHGEPTYCPHSLR